MGAFLISGSIFNKVKGECNEGLGEGWPRKFLRHFVNGSSKRKSSQQEFSGITKIFQPLNLSPSLFKRQNAWLYCKLRKMKI
jgi:hypothetical protein